MRGMRWAAMAAATMMLAGPAAAFTVIHTSAEAGGFTVPLALDTTYYVQFIGDPNAAPATAEYDFRINWDIPADDPIFSSHNSADQQYPLTRTQQSYGFDGSFHTMADYFVPGVGEYVTFTMNRFVFGCDCGVYEGPAWTVTISDSPIAAPEAVPEPATWALMIAGLGMAGTELRRRRLA